MNQADLVEKIGDMLTKLDKMLIGPKLVALPAKWQAVYAVRKNLDDQQRVLVKQTLDANDVQFKALTGVIEKATAELQKVADQIEKIDTVINAISQVSASLDGILKMIP